MTARPGGAAKPAATCRARAVTGVRSGGLQHRLETEQMLETVHSSHFDRRQALAAQHAARQSSDGSWTLSPWQVGRNNRVTYIGKQEPDGAARSRGKKRRWTVLRLPGHRDARIDGLEILEEISGNVSVAVWQVYRDGLEWINTPQELRAGLFRAPASSSEYLQLLVESAAEEPVAAALQTAWAVLNGEGGAAQSSLRELTRAFVAIAAWADENGFRETAAGFAFLAASARPRDADLAFRAGRAERRCARYHQAEAWFHRSIGLARRSGDFAAYSSAYLGWGLLAEERGMRTEARRLYTKALRAAQRGGLRGLMAAARHNLIPLCIPDRPFEEGQAHIVGAYRLYDPTNAPIARLACDAGTFYGDHRYYSEALDLFNAALPHIKRPAERTAVYSNISRAAAAMGMTELFTTAQTHVIAEIDDPTEFTAPALVEVALAANSLGYQRKSRAWAAEALRIARMRASRAGEEAALRTLAELEAGREPDKVQPAPRKLQRFIARFVSRLKEADPTP